MFGKTPIKVEIDAKNLTVDHEINVGYVTVIRTERLICHAGKTAILVIGAAALAKTSTEIVTHIVKTHVK